MRVCVVGAGYVGLVTATCLADMGNAVICVDKNKERVEALNNNEIPIYEPGLNELVSYNTRENRLSFTGNLQDAVEQSDCCFIAVGTPQLPDGSADISGVYNVVDEIAEAATNYKVIIIKSTVPVGTANTLLRRLNNLTSIPISVVSNPEFLKQGDAVNDFMKPDRIIIGTHDDRSAALMKDLYAPFMRTGNRLLLMDNASAEMAKYASNAFLSTKISFMNEIANLCECMGADVERVRYGMACDPRIGAQFLFAGLGYGGSCFPKDVKALSHGGKQHQYLPRLLESVDTINNKQRYRFIQKINSFFNNNLSGKRLAVWGLAYKPNTDDMRDAPSLTIIEALLEQGVDIHVYDPKATESAKRLLKERVTYYDSKYECLENADAMLLLTEWNEFRRPDFERMFLSMKRPIIFDGRNQYEPDNMHTLGFTYLSVGRTPVFAPNLSELLPITT